MFRAPAAYPPPASPRRPASSAAMMSGFAVWMELPAGPCHTVFPGPRDTSHHFPSSVGIQEMVLQMSDGCWAQRIALVEFLAESPHHPLTDCDPSFEIISPSLNSW